MTPLAPFQAHSATSRDAALSVRHVSPTMRQLVLDAIRREGPCTDLDLERLTGMAGSTVRPRRVELVRDGLVVASGYARTPSGRRATLYRAAVVQERLL